MLKKYGMDFAPFKKYRDFRLVWVSGFISHFGIMLTYVALPFQLKELTNSYLAVGLLGLVELLPLIIFGLYGGVLADHIDRRKMLLLTEAAALLITAVLLVNALLPNPKVWLIYFVTVLFAAVDGLQRPSADAMLPRLVDHQDLPAANSLISLRRQFNLIVAPSIAGVLIATSGVKIAFALDVVSYLVGIFILLKVRPVPSSKESEKPSFSSLVGGLQYALGRKDLLGTYCVDLAAMFFAFPYALFPFWAEKVNAPWSLGFFYASLSVGAFLVIVTSRWINHVNHHGRAITFAAIGWGAAITLAGLVDNVWWVLLCLTISGACDEISALFRSAVWNQSISDEYRGRLAGIELLSYSIGPLGGQARSGLVADRTSLRTSVVSGGLLCIGFVMLAAKSFPKFWNYDVTTNEYAVAERIKRAKVQ